MFVCVFYHIFVRHQFDWIQLSVADARAWWSLWRFEYNTIFVYGKSLNSSGLILHWTIIFWGFLFSQQRSANQRFHFAISIKTIFILFLSNMFWILWQFALKIWFWCSNQGIKRTRLASADNIACIFVTICVLVCVYIIENVWPFSPEWHFAARGIRQVYATHNDTETSFVTQTWNSYRLLRRASSAYKYEFFLNDGTQCVMCIWYDFRLSSYEKKITFTKILHISLSD